MESPSCAGKYRRQRGTSILVYTSFSESLRDNRPSGHLAGGFQGSLQPQLAEALVAQRWRVDMTTASAATPLDIEAYDLIVLGAPSYNWTPARPITSYVQRLRDLHGKNVVLIVSGGGMTERAMDRLRAQVEAAHGHLVEALELWISRPNLVRFGTTEPQEIMHKLGEDLARRLA